MGNSGVQQGGNSDLPRWVVPVIAGLVGAIAFIASMGAAKVHPANIDWLMHADYALHFLGWHLYRAGPWTWPIGATPLHIWPVGSSIGLTDSIPIFAFLFKPLDPVLPPIFQFIGIWLTTSYALQGVFGALLMAIATPRPVLQFLGALLFIFSPPLVFRLGHAALTAHWLVLAALWLSLKEGGDTPTLRRAAAWALLAAVTAAIQPYILVMIVALMGAAYLRQFLAAPRRLLTIATHAALGLAAAWVALWQSGSLMVAAGDGLGIGGFGEWSANLLTFIMPTEPLTLTAPGVIRYARPPQYEGYAYLGAGLLLLGVIVLAAGVRSRPAPGWAGRIWPYLPLLAALLFLAVMAFGQPVGFGSRILFTYDSSWWGPFRIFRTNGRMIWAVFYAVVVAILFAVTRFRYRTAVGVLSLGVLVQAVDLSPAPAFIADAGLHGFRSPLNSRFWDIAAPHYQRIILIPSNLCERNGYVDYLAFALLAGRHRMAINAGTTARYDVPRAAQYCKALEQEMAAGLTTPGSLYVLRRDLLAQVARPVGANGPICTSVDGLGVCVAADSYAPWRDDYEIPRANLPRNGDLEEFYTALDALYRDALGRPPESRPDTASRRVDALARYLANRSDGCSHEEAEARTLAIAQGYRDPAACETFSSRPALPPGVDTYAFARRYVETMGQRSDIAATTTHLDLEAEAAWLQEYVALRLAGQPHRSAIEAVIEQVRRPSR